AACDQIGGLGVAEIEQLAGQLAARDPPLIGVMDQRGIVRRGQRELGSFAVLLLAVQPDDPAEDEAGIVVRIARNLVDQGLGVGGLVVGGGTGFGNDHFR